MNNAKSTALKREIKISIYTLIWYFKCTYYLILLYAYHNKRELKCKLTPLVLTYWHH